MSDFSYSSYWPTNERLKILSFLLFDLQTSMRHTMNKCLLSRPGLIAGPLRSTPLQIISQSIPRLDPIDSKSSLFIKMVITDTNKTWQSDFNPDSVLVRSFPNTDDVGLTGIFVSQDIESVSSENTPGEEEENESPEASLEEEEPANMTQADLMEECAEDEWSCHQKGKWGSGLIKQSETVNKY